MPIQRKQIKLKPSYLWTCPVRWDRGVDFCNVCNIYHCILTKTRDEEKMVENLSFKGCESATLISGHPWRNSKWEF